MPHRVCDIGRPLSPSSGSKATQKRPAFSAGTMMGSSFSSLTSTEHAPELTRADTKISFERTSSFFWSSPLEFWSPAMPKRLAMPALAHAREVALHARPSCAIRMVSCGRTHTQRAQVKRPACGRAVRRSSDLHVFGVAHQPPAERHEVGLITVIDNLVVRHVCCQVEQRQGETRPLAARVCRRCLEAQGAPEGGVLKMRRSGAKKISKLVAYAYVAHLKRVLLRQMP